MIGYLAGRIFQGLVILLVMSAIVYGLIGLMPGDPVDLMINADPRMNAVDAAHLRALYGLDRPLIERYGHWLAQALTGDFGYSRLYGKLAIDVLVPALGQTARLMGAALTLSFALALPLGMLAASRPRSPLDYGINLAAFIGISIPPFWLALMLIIVFAVLLGALPASGVDFGGDAGVWNAIRPYVLPVATLTLASVGGHIRYVRAAMIDALAADYIRTARAKGLSEIRIRAHHALPAAMVPVVTIIGLDFGTLFSGALVTETVFAVPGMGRLIYDSIMGNDYNLALIALLFATAVTVIGSILADVAYVAIDPRVSLDGQQRR